MRFLHIWIALAFIILMFIKGEWRSSKKYYSTILFFIAGNMIYNHMVNDDMLWKWTSPVFNHEFVGLLWCFTIFPSTVLLFLPNYLKLNRRGKKINYILIYVIIYSLLEYIVFYFGQISYYNGWKFYYSIGVYLLLFPMLVLHHKKPILAWSLFMALAYTVLYVFDLPLRVFK